MSLASKLYKAQTVVADATKDARNGHHGYSYAKADTVYALGKVALQDAGLVIVNKSWNSDPATHTVTGTFLILDTETDETMELSASLPYVAQAGRPDDKAALASLTEMRGYVMLGLLGIERVEPLDVSGREDSTIEPQRRQEPQRQQQRPPQRHDDDHGHGPGQCEHCGADMKISQKTGKPYCGAMCWKEREPAGNGRTF